MPEYLAPGVFVEEVSFRSKSIEGVPTSTTGMAGLTSYGPVYFLGGPVTCEPRLITSFTEFERVYGGLELLHVGDAAPGTERVPYLAHAVRSFFENGGKRVYISRVYIPRNDSGVALRTVTLNGGDQVHWRARWPGEAGNVYVTTEVTRSKNLLYIHDEFGAQAQRVKAGAVVEIIPAATDPEDIPKGNDSPEIGCLRVVEIDAEGKQTFIKSDGLEGAPDNDDIVQLIEMTVTVTVNSERVDQSTELGAHPDQKRYIGRILQQDEPEGDGVVWFDLGNADTSIKFLPALIIKALRDNTEGRLGGGHDGALPTPDDLAGQEADPDNPSIKATGLEALAEIDDIAIVAMPDTGEMSNDTDSRVAAQKLVSHAERERYRIAIVDPPIGSSLNDVRNFRGQFDSKYAAMYYPWIEIFDPNERLAQGAPPRQLVLPPSGFVAGIYARNDIARGVHKAPANEIVRGLTKFEVNINKPRQEVINPEGINALRFFEGRGYRVWGARTMSSDPEWKYVNVRRLFIYIEHSIDKGTQWAVFEPNNHRLWNNIRQTVEDFLLVLWKDGALLGEKPEEAFFVRCDRTTMTQNDLDNGRLICLVGVAPVKPAEFVIFRIGQWTADAKV